MTRLRLAMPWSLLAGLVLLSATGEALKGNVLVLNKLRSKPDDTPAPSPEDKGTTEEAAGNGTLAEAAATNSTSGKPALTGIPQLDYVHDPNLPRELNGFNLKDYPFYDRVPEEMDFKCDGLHDGFYASVLHKCQVYHHCLFGTRYDFLCANYTAFDQKTFICHFVSEVDCVNSPKYFSRNEALYKAASTTTLAPLTRATLPPPPPRRQPDPEEAGAPAPRRRRPYRRRRPVYDYVYDDEYEDDLADYEEDAVATQGRSSSVRSQHPAADDQPRRKRPRPQQRPAAGQDDLPSGPAADLKPRPSSSVYDRPRMAPKIRRPVPLNERDKYEYSKNPNIVTTPAGAEASARPKAQPAPSAPALEDDYYYDDEEVVQPSRGGSRTRPAQEYYPDEGEIERRPLKAGGGGSPRRNVGRAGSRKRVPSAAAAADADTPYATRHEAEEYDEFYDEAPRRVVRPSGARRRVKDNLRDEEEYVRRPAQAGGFKSRPRAKPQRVEPEDYYVDEDPVPAARPAFISRPQSNRDGYSNRRRPQQPADTTAADYVPPRSQAASDYKRPAGRKPSSSSRYTTGYGSDAEYYDDTEDLPEEPESYRSHPKQTALPARSTSSGNQYQAAAREADSVPTAPKARPYAASSRSTSSNSPSYQPLAPQYSSGKSQPARNYPLSSLIDAEDHPLQKTSVYREKAMEEDRELSPALRRNNKVPTRDSEPIEPPVILMPKGFTPQSNIKLEESRANTNPSRTIPSYNGDESRRRLTADSPSSGPSSKLTGSNSYQPKVIPSRDTVSRTSFGGGGSGGGDSRGYLVTSASQTQYTRAPFPTHSKDIVLEVSASDADDHTGRISPVSSPGGSFNQRHTDQFSSSPKRASIPELPTGEYVYTPQSRQAWSQQRKRSSSQYLSSPN
ncbi:nucleolar protein dao-5 isoform X2 [Bacillus rossius redtenbacheri]|uniref:nucleolar protein dao-5 isoform X2 n=1 Tax=Bacillus rossius redtenbacheri TaxID=93214 RepID=UPI002FDCDEB2